MNAKPALFWPSAGLESQKWDAAAEYGSRRARLAARGPFQSVVPPLIARQILTLDSELSAELEHATGELIRFDAMQGLSAPLSSILLRSESASSSEVENLTASAKQIALAEIQNKPTPNAALIVDNALAMRAAVSLEASAAPEAVLGMHRALLERSRPDIAGVYRTRPVWIGGLSPHTAVFVGPDHRRILELMTDLDAFINRFDLPRLAQIAIAHAQFETIHPFEDGNGRTGRALVQVLLRKYGLATQSTIPVSAGLLSKVSNYFEALNQYRSGDVRPILEAFVLASLKAVDLGTELVNEITEANELHSQLCTDREGSVARRLIPLLSQHPALDGSLVQELLGVSQPSALAGLTRLSEQGILLPANDKKRSRIWVAPRILEALDVFAAKARRG
jgi:Fic family protein